MDRSRVAPLAFTALAAAFLVTVFPDVAHACPTCFSANDANRVAYITTYVIMTLLPLAFVGGLVYWLFGRYAAQEAEMTDGPDLD